MSAAYRITVGQWIYDDEGSSVAVAVSRAIKRENMRRSKAGEQKIETAIKNGVKIGVLVQLVPAATTEA